MEKPDPRCGSPLGKRDDLDVYLDPPYRMEMAQAALSVLKPKVDKLRQRIAEAERDKPARVLPAKFITDAVTQPPDALPPDFT